MLRNSSDVIKPYTREPWTLSSVQRANSLRSQRWVKYSSYIRIVPFFLDLTIEIACTALLFPLAWLQWLKNNCRCWHATRTLNFMPEFFILILTAIITQSDQLIHLKLVEPVGDRLSHGRWPTYALVRLFTKNAFFPSPCWSVSINFFEFGRGTTCLAPYLIHHFHHFAFLIRGPSRLRGAPLDAPRPGSWSSSPRPRECQEVRQPPAFTALKNITLLLFVIWLC